MVSNRRVSSSRGLGDSVHIDLDLFSPPDTSKLGWIAEILMVQLWSDDKDVVIDGLRQLGDLWDSSDEETVSDRQSVFDVGGPFAIVAAMNKWYTSRRITIDGCRAIANVGANTPFRDAVVNAGGFEVVLLGMKNFPGDEIVQRNGCAALCRLCLNNTQNAIYFGLELEGWSCLVDAMDAFPEQSALLNFSVSMLYDVSHVEQLKYPITQAGILKLLACTSEKLRDSNEEHEKALREKARVTMHRLVACE